MSNDTILTTQNELDDVPVVDNENDVQSNDSDCTSCTDITTECINVFNKDIQELNNKLNDVKYSADANIDTLYDLIYDVRQKTNVQLAELNVSSSGHKLQLTEQDKKIKNLEETAVNHTEQLKQSWVRIMSTKEYNKLVTPPDNAPYNERYKYPNTLYFIVDYNKPKAVYIGDILIAKAEGKGPNGFAYNFPISF